ncbi:MAG: hypothetical protein JWN23_2277 [Rhodocyclales bacterium]|nr:hypothetical protein [Rhodocyclales bacterium]
MRLIPVTESEFNFELASLQLIKENIMEAIGKFDGSNSVANAHNTINKAADAARPAVDRLASGAHQAVDRLADVASSAADTLSVRGAQIRDAQAKLAGQARSYVSAHPLATVGIAVAAGFLISRLFSSSSR